MTGPPLRIGILGASKIAPMALVGPAKRHPGTVVRAVAARDGGRAARFARRHGIPVSVAGYENLLARDDIDIVYNSLVPGGHAEWTIRALEAGKHVLCEKPFAMNAGEAERMVAAGKASGRILMEAFHYRYFPLFDRAMALCRETGPARHIDFSCVMPMPTRFAGAKLMPELGGGATMEMGCYGVHAARSIAGEEPDEVRAAAIAVNRTDRDMVADLTFPSGLTARLWSSFRIRRIRNNVRVTGDNGELRWRGLTMPFPFLHKLTWTADGETHTQKGQGRKTWDYQLDAFIKAIQTGEAPPTSGEDSINNTRVIDRIYQAAGLR